MPVNYQIKDRYGIYCYEGTVTYDVIFDVMKNSWERPDWSRISRVLAVLGATTETVMDTYDPALLGRMFTASIVNKEQYWQAYVIPSHREDLLESCRMFADSFMDKDNIRVEFFDCVDKACKWLSEGMPTQIIRGDLPALPALEPQL